MNWEIGIGMYTLLCIKWITNKNLVYNKINKIQKEKIFNQKNHASSRVKEKLEEISDKETV